MSNDRDAEICQWDGTDGHGLCDKPATRHVSWTFDSGYPRNAHFCDPHAADVCERKADAHSAPIGHCDARCLLISKAL